MSTERRKGRAYEEIAERLRAVRASMDLEQKDFASRAGITPQAYSNWESGNYRISIDGALRLRDTYGLTLDFIYCGNLSALPHNIAKAVSSNPRVINSQ